MTTDHDEYDESFLKRNRGKLGVAGVLAVIILAVFGYNLSKPKPTTPASDLGSSTVGGGGTLAVGALPVT
jgi:hypothetical protein